MPRHELTYTDEATGLQLRCVAIEYRDFPTAEWTVYFKNTDRANTPILADIQVLVFTLQRPGAAVMACEKMGEGRESKDERSCGC